MILLDAYALTALLAEEPAAGEVGQLIADGGVVVTAPNLAEAADGLGRIHGIAVQRTRKRRRIARAVHRLARAPR